ncbi:MAG: glycosyltransferase family 4 protein [Candidatus Dormibacteria bacterium]
MAWFGHGDENRGDGLSTYTRDLVGGLRARGAEVLLVTSACDGRPGASAAGRLVLDGVAAGALTVSGPGSMRRVEQALGDFAPDVVHVSWSFSTLDGPICRAAHALGAATVATFHLPYATPGSSRARLLAGLYRYHRAALRHVDSLIALSTTQAALLVRAGVPAERILVVANGVDVNAITPGRSRLRDQLGDAFVVAYLGRLDREKRVGALIEAVAKQAWPPHRLLIAGTGSQAGRLQRLAGRSAAVRLMGRLATFEERLDLLRAADVVVLPSTAEGLALSMLEAMAAGCAVVATDAGDDGEALGDAGVVIPVHPLEPHLSRALAMLQADPPLRHRLGRAARQRCVDRYPLGRVIDDVLAVYAGLRSGRAPSPPFRHGGAVPPQP